MVCVNIRSCSYIPYCRFKYREDYIWSYKLRAKMLVNTSAVVAVGHHM